jgi:dTDP-glucose 4,6-dehydratase
MDRFGKGRYFFEKADVCDRAAIERVIGGYEIDTIVHFAAETHVDRSIHGPEAFIRTNIVGTFTLLDVARTRWAGRNDVLFHHVSTDEVYGSLGSSGYFYENTAYNPRSPYSASKASSDHLVLAYYHTYNLPVTISNSSNNYGPYQFPEKLIPLMILNMKENKPLPIYGDGKNIRDWLFVEDHNSSIWTIVKSGKQGEKYNVGGENELETIELIRILCELTAEVEGKPPDEYKKLLSFVKDRPGHDRRYALNCSKIKSDLGWHREVEIAEGLKKTIEWYLANDKWVNHVRSGEYRTWLERNYVSR